MVALWAVFEAAIVTIASFIQKQEAHRIKIQDIRGKDFLDRSKKYFDHFLGFTLCTKDVTWQQLKTFILMRNAIAHGNGQKESINEDSWRKIKDIVKSNADVSISDDCILFSEPFVRKMQTIVEETITDLIQRVYAKYAPRI